MICLRVWLEERLRGESGVASRFLFDGMSGAERSLVVALSVAIAAISESGDDEIVNA